MIRYLAAVICVAFGAVSLSACGPDDDELQVADNAATDESGDTVYDYEVILANAVTDTLRGTANFGRVLDPRTGDKLFVIRLSTGFDFAGGVVISRRDTLPPEPGSYSLSVPADSLVIVPVEQFLIIYREGMLRDLRSTSGTLTFSTVNDSLIEGRFNATLRGVIADRGRELTEGEIHAVGRFRAGQGMSGYVIGL